MQNNFLSLGNIQIFRKHSKIPAMNIPADNVAEV